MTTRRVACCDEHVRGAGIVKRRSDMFSRTSLHGSSLLEGPCGSSVHQAGERAELGG